MNSTIELSQQEKEGERREKFVNWDEIDSASGEDKGEKMMTRVRKQIEGMNISDEGQENCEKRDFLDD